MSTGVVIWGLAVVAVVLGPIWTSSGFVLSYDMVAVPQQSLEPWMWGAGTALPRAVPQDVFVATLDNVIPGALLQKLLLTSSLVVGAVGVCRLLGRLGGVGQMVALTAYVWSAFVYERLVIGHWGLLMAFGAMPWVLLLAGRVRDGGRRAAGGLVLAAFLGTWVPSGGVMLVLVSGAVVLWPNAASPLARRLLPLAGVLAVQLTWLVPALTSARSGIASSGAFGLRPDGAAGAVLAALSGSGIWNQAAAPASRSGVLGVAAPLIVASLVLVGLRPLAAALEAGVFRPLMVVAVALLGWSVATALPALARIVAAVERLPGGGLLRDGQKWLAPWWLLASLAMGAAAAALARRLGSDPPARALVLSLVLVPVVLLPDLAWGAAGRLTPARYPDDWEQVSRVLSESDDDTAVVSLPWGAFRRFEWNRDRVVLDPAPRYLARDVITDAGLLVGTATNPTLVPSDDPRSTRIERALQSADPVADLRGTGVGWVLVQRDQPAGRLGEVTLEGRAGVRVAWSGPWLVLLQLEGDTRAAQPVDRRWLFAVAWLVTLGTVCLAVSALRPRNKKAANRQPTGG